MSGRLQATGTAAQIRGAMLHFPHGATAAELRRATSGKLTPKAIHRTLASMHHAGAITGAADDAGRMRWSLTEATRIQVQRIAATTAEHAARRAQTVIAAAPCAPATEGFAMTTAQKKAHESARIAAQIQAFEAAGGKVQVLGNTPLRRDPGYRQTMTGIAVHG